MDSQEKKETVGLTQEQIDMRFDRIEAIEEEVNKLCTELGKEIAPITQEKGFDQNKEKYRKRVKKLCKKYAPEMHRLMKEHDHLIDELAEEEDRKYKAQFRD